MVFFYFGAVIFLGFLVRKKATEDTDSFYLAGRRVPWWMLGLSGCSSYIDITGTMLMIGLLFYLGFQGVWVTHIFWGWLIIAGYMAFQANWIRRSGVMTFPEWNVTRFGPGKDTEAARLVSAAFLLVLMLANLTYTAVGIGKFATIYLPWGRATCTILILGVVGTYVTLGGFFGVILTDILQTILIAVGAVVLAYLAVHTAGPENWKSMPPGAWWDLFPSRTIGDDMLGKAPAYYQQFREFTPLLLCGFVWLIARVLAGPNVWDFQFFLSARSPRDAALAGGVWTVGHTFRWFMAIGLLSFGFTWFEAGRNFDSELIMPKVIAGLPAGLKGLLLAILLAAFMSTFDAMINVTSNVAVNDFLRRYFLKNLSEKVYVRFGQFFSLAFLGIDATLSLTFENVNAIWEAMIFSVVTAILVPSMLRWHWGRFNAKGFTIGVILTGLTCCLDVVLRGLVPGYPEQWKTLPLIVLLSLAYSVISALATAPTDWGVRVDFYSKIRPFGFWGRERKEAASKGLLPENDYPPLLDAFNLLVASVFQISLCLIPFNLILGRNTHSAVSFLVTVITGGVLYFTWYRFLPEKSVMKS